MRPICCLGCQPPPSSQQVLCAVLCVTVGARLVLREVADCFEFSQCIAAQHSSACTHTHTRVKHKYAHMHLCVHVEKLLDLVQTAGISVLFLKLDF